MVLVPDKDPVPELLDAAWASIQEELADNEAGWKAQLSTPIAKANDAATGAIAKQVTREMLGLMIRAMMESQFRCQYAEAQKLLPTQQFQAIVAGIMGFAQAVQRGMKVSCTGAACDWKGTAGDAGPNGTCQKCGGKAVPIGAGLVIPKGVARG